VSSNVAMENPENPPFRRMMFPFKPPSFSEISQLATFDSRRVTIYLEKPIKTLVAVLTLQTAAPRCH